ncbi:MAG: TIR domain-containing protein [Anaerolineales bacterium]
MTNTKRHLKVFLCHASNDKDKVYPLYMYLVRRGVDAWLDTERLLPGQNWRVEIPKAIEASDAIIICLSKQSVDKEGYVQKEIKFALDRASEMPEDRIFLIPARLEACEIPSSLSDYQWVDLFDKPEGFDKLLRALNERANQLGCAPVQTFRGEGIIPQWVSRINPAAQPVPTSPASAGETVLSGGAQPGHTAPQAGQGETDKPFWQRTEVIVAIIGAMATLAAALIGLLPTLMPPAPAASPTATFTVTAPAPTWTNIPAGMLPSSSQTPTAVSTAAPSPITTATPTLTPVQSATPTAEVSPTSTVPPERLISIGYNKLDALLPPQRFISAVQAVDISPDNRWVASGERNGRVTISTVSELGLFKQFDYKRVVNVVAFSPNGRWLVAAGEGGQIMVIDTAMWDKPVFLTGHTDTVNALDFSPDGRLLVSGGLDGTLRFWDVPAFVERNAINTSRRIYALDVHPAGGQVAVGASDGIVRVWNTDGQFAYELESASGPTQSVIDLQFSPDGDFLVVASSDPNHPYVLWDILTRKIRLEFGSGLRARGVSFSPDGLVLITHTRDRQLTVWRAVNGSRLIFFEAHQDEIWSAAVSRDGTLIATCSGDKTVRLWGIP